MAFFPAGFLKPFFLLAILILPSQLLAWGNDTLVPFGEYSIEMRGRILKSQGQAKDDQKVPLDSAQVSVINEGGKNIWTGVTDAKGRLNIKLPLGKKFTMWFTKKGFVKKMISVDTHVPGEIKKSFAFAFDIDIFEKVEGLDVSVLNQPVAMISYRPLDKEFSYDAAYTNKVNAGLQKMYREYYTIKKREELAAQSSDSVSTKPAIKPAAPKKPAPYGQVDKPR